MAKKPFMKRYAAQKQEKKSSAAISDIEHVIVNKHPDELNHDTTAHLIMTDIARPDVEPEGQIIRVDISLVYAEEQVRPEEDFDDHIIDGMSESYDTIGILTPPRCYPRDKRGFKIWMGETRVRSARKRGDTHIDIYVGKPPKDRKERILGQLIENLQQSGLKPLATAKSFYELKNDFNMTGEQIAKAMGKPTSFVSKHLRLIDAPDSVIELLRDKVISDVDLAYTLVQVSEKAPDEADKLVAVARESGITRADVKTVLDSVKNKVTSNISHAKSQRKDKPKTASDSWLVVVEFSGEEGVILTDKAPEKSGYLWIKSHKGDASVAASDIHIKELRSK